MFERNFSVDEYKSCKLDHLKMDEQKLQGQSNRILSLSKTKKCLLKKWHVSEGQKVRTGSVLCKYFAEGDSKEEDLRSPCVGVVKHLAVREEQFVDKSCPVVVVTEKCDHSVVVHDLCSDCGMDMQRIRSTATVSMIHSAPQIKLSKEEASVIANRDKQHLLSKCKLALIVDLDQTLIHTSMNPSIPPGLPDVYEFLLVDHPFTYHCRLRPHTRSFLEKVSKLFELHVFTMGTRSYAEQVTNIIDPGRKYFCRRILSRDEFIDPRSKSVSLESVFPEGTEMVVIIDDREDVWRKCPNLVHVKPYLFFADVGDINAPPNGTVQNDYPLPQRRPSSSNSDDPPVKIPRVDTQEGAVGPEGDNCSHKSGLCEAVNDSNSVSASHETKESSDNSSHCKEPEKEGESTPVENQLADLPSPSSEGEATENVSDPPVADSQDSSDDSSSSSSSSNSGSDSDSSSSSDEENESNSAKRKMKSVENSSPKLPEIPSSANPDNNTTNDAVSNVETREQQPRAEMEKIATPSPEKPPKQRKKIRDNDNFLLHLGDILERIHQSFYKAHTALSSGENPSTRPPDVKLIIPELRFSVFRSVRILFTGVIPNNQPVERNREWNTARAFGAEIHTDVELGLDSTHEWKRKRATTHVVVGKKGTEKLKKALKVPGLKFVTVKWLWACAEQWKVLSEENYRVDGIDYSTLPKLAVSQPQTLHSRSKSATVSGPPQLSLKLRTISVPEDSALLSPSSLVSFTPKEWDEMSKEVDDEISSGEEDNPSDVSLAMDTNALQSEEEEAEEEELYNLEENEQNEEVNSSGSSDDSNDDSEDELAKLI
jgi:RNA polymerase II subunit A-like phosphatase